jgi:hypothetical protein
MVSSTICLPHKLSEGEACIAYARKEAQMQRGPKEETLSPFSVSSPQEATGRWTRPASRTWSQEAWQDTHVSAYKSRRSIVSGQIPAPRKKHQSQMALGSSSGHHTDTHSKKESTKGKGVSSISNQSELLVLLTSAFRHIHSPTMAAFVEPGA